MKDSAGILLVEDNPDDVFFMKRAFQTCNISNRLNVVMDGRTAIDYLAGNKEFQDRERYPLPCIVLLDLKLPYKTGHEVLEWIRQQPQFIGLIVIVLTTSREEIDIEKAYKLGCNAFVVKPGNPALLIDFIKSVQAFWLGQNIVPHPAKT